MINWIKSLFKKCDHDWKHVCKTDCYAIYISFGKSPYKKNKNLCLFKMFKN